MIRFREFLTSSFLAAAGVLIPILLIIFILEKVLEMIGAFMGPPLMVLLPQEYLEKVPTPKLLALILFVLASLLLGLFAQTEVGKRLGHWLEDRTFMHLRLYRSIKEFSDRLLPTNKSTLFQPALLTRRDEMNTLIFVVEKLDDDNYVIFLPSTPSVLTGALAVVPQADVKILHIEVKEAARVFSLWGVGCSKILREQKAVRHLQTSEKR